MAQKSKLFMVPTAFEFATSKGNWIPSFAVVLDWWRPEFGEAGFGEVNTEFVKVGIQNGPAAGRTFQVKIEELPEEIFDLCATSAAGSDIANLCSGLEYRLLVNILKSPTSAAGDAWVMRRDFLEMASSSS
jgi:hypothetical protein